MGTLVLQLFQPSQELNFLHVRCYLHTNFHVFSIEKLMCAGIKICCSVSETHLLM